MQQHLVFVYMGSDWTGQGLRCQFFNLPRVGELVFVGSVRTRVVEVGHVETQQPNGSSVHTYAVRVERESP